MFVITDILQDNTRDGNRRDVNKLSTPVKNVNGENKLKTM